MGHDFSAIAIYCVLTYMSIHDAINALEVAGELFHVPSLFLGEDAPRTIYVSCEVAQLVYWTPPEGREGRLASNARGLLDSFVEGGYVTFGEDPFDKEASCIMARVHPVEKELMDLRCLDPNPGLRLLGGFAEPDMFVVLTWDYRDNFDDEWPEQVARCENEWVRLFGSTPRHKGRSVNDYISFNVRAV